MDRLRTRPFRPARGAGASQDHPHSQLVATAFGAPRLEALERRAVRHRRRTGTCLFCRIMAGERKDGRRVLRDDGAFLAVVPFAALPYEIWVLAPHGARFAALADREAEAFGDALRQVLRLLRHRAGDPEYNLAVHAPPASGVEVGRAEHSGQPTGSPGVAESFHWHARIRPLVASPGGLEVAAGVWVSPLLPERAAADLRAEGGVSVR